MTSANELMFRTLLMDPEKRKKVLELLTNEGLVPQSENAARTSRNNTSTSKCTRLEDLSRFPLVQLLSPKQKTINRKPLYESPSELFRWRALQKMQSESSVDESADEKPFSPPPVGIPVPFDQLLKHVVAYCEVRSKGSDRSAAIKAMMKAMGATIREEFTRDLTHVIFKEGSFSTFQKAKLLKVHLVSVLWLEAVRRHKFLVPEKKYPALGVEACEANVTAICQALEHDYNDCIQDEYRRRSEVKHQSSVSSKNNVVTNRRKISCASKSYSTDLVNMPGITRITESTSSTTPTPNSSTSSSQMSGSSFKNFDDIVPCSQDGPSSLSNSHKGNGLLELTTDESSEHIDSSCTIIARHIKDSLELEKSRKIRSSERLTNKTLSVNSSISKKTDESSKLVEEELSLRLHITTTDESNANSTGNKSKSSSMDAQAQIESNDAEKDVNESSKPKKKYTRRMTLGVSNSKSVMNLNESSESRISTMNTSAINKSLGSLNNLTESKKQKEVTPKQVKRQRAAIFKLNKTTESDENLNIITDVTKSNENVHREQENRILLNNNDENIVSNQNLEINSDNRPAKPRRRKLYNDNYDNLILFNSPRQIAAANAIQMEIEKLKLKQKYHVVLPPNLQIPKTMSKNARKVAARKTTATKTGGSVKKNTKLVQKLEFSSSSSDEHPQDCNERPIRKSPRKVDTEIRNDPMKDYAHLKKPSPKKIMSNAKAASNESDALFKEISPAKKPRKCATTECSSDKETSNDELQDTDTHCQPNKSCVTPARRSMRLNISRIDPDNEQNEVPKTPSTAVRRSTRKIIHNASPTPMKTPAKTSNLRKQILTSKTSKKSASSSDEAKCKSERRSTLEFVQRPSRESLERMKLTQKSKHVKLCSIVCTRLHKGDVQVFQQIVKQLGGFIVENEVTEKTTHLVAGAATRTINMLRAIVRGCWIVRQEWLIKSLAAGKWLEEEEFELTEFSPAVQKCRLQKKSFGPLYSLDIFNECGSIFVSQSSNPRRSDLEELVNLCGGNVVKTPRLARIIVGGYFRYNDTFCVNEKWILDCITHNKKKSLKSYLLEVC